MGGIGRLAVFCAADGLCKTCFRLNRIRSSTSSRARAAHRQARRFPGPMLQPDAIQRVFHQCDRASIFPGVRGGFDLDQTPGQQGKHVVDQVQFREGRSGAPERSGLTQIARLHRKSGTRAIALSAVAYKSLQLRKRALAIFCLAALSPPCCISPVNTSRRFWAGGPLSDYPPFFFAPYVLLNRG